MRERVGKRRRRSLLGLVLLAAPALVIARAPSAGADFQSVAPRWLAWQWTTEPGVQQSNPRSTLQVRAVSVRSDGWLIVAAEDALHLIPPWGADISQSNLFGPEGFDPYDMVMRNGDLYATVQTDTSEQTCDLYKIDPYSGQILSTYSYSWMQCYIPHITLDPLTNDLVLQASESPPCPPDPQDYTTLPFVPGAAQPSCGGPTQNPIVEWVPGNDYAGTLVANPKTPYSDLGFAADGTAVYVGEMVEVPQSAPLYIDAYARHQGILSNGPMYRVPLAGDTGVDGITVGNGSRCFGNSIIYTDSWSDVYWVPTPGPGSTTSVEVATTPATPGPVRYADAAGNITRDAAGNAVIGEYNSVMVVSCPGFTPPRPPRVPLPTLSAVSHVVTPGHPAASGAASPGQPPPLAGPGGPPPAPALGASQGSTQVVAAPNAAGVGDVVEDQPAFHLTASGRPPGPIVDLGAGALIVTGLAACAWSVLEAGDRRRERFQTGESK